ncbi:hypothetical protein G7Z17_g8789 [Cylindrodendrum hubeiense]|uniref:Secreted protein n=1 Tax=Cylindrodendrum hubeiense TaxID=595255 RepID=A0A9P5LEC6_9HYPO|nr:hypothetical protein G7Z17_g8789 [Cylindrodendrum hubeiense]
MWSTHFILSTLLAVCSQASVSHRDNHGQDLLDLRLPKVPRLVNHIQPAPMSDQSPHRHQVFPLLRKEMSGRLRDAVRLPVHLRRTTHHNRHAVPHRHVRPGLLFHMRDAPVCGPLNYPVFVWVSFGSPNQDNELRLRRTNAPVIGTSLGPRRATRANPSVPYHHDHRRCMLDVHSAWLQKTRNCFFRVRVSDSDPNRDGELPVLGAMPGGLRHLLCPGQRHAGTCHGQASSIGFWRPGTRFIPVRGPGGVASWCGLHSARDGLSATDDAIYGGPGAGDWDHGDGSLLRQVTSAVRVRRVSTATAPSLEQSC